MYSALGSFYLPSCIMVFVYIRIYFAAKKRARRGINKKSRNKLDPVSDPLPLSTHVLTTNPMTPLPPTGHPLHVNQLLPHAVSA